MGGSEYDFEAIKGLAKKWGTQWEEKSTKAHGHITSGKLGQEVFSQAQAAAQFGTRYTEAQAVYLATIQGVKDDLALFEAKLRAAAEDMELRDGNAAEVMQTLAARWTSDEGFHSEREKAEKQQEFAEQRKNEQDGQGSGAQTEQTAVSDGDATGTDATGTDATGTDGGTDATGGGQTSADGTGQQVYGGGDGATPPADDQDTTTQSYASDANPYAGNAPQY